jgi:hypothetical protein
MVVLPNAPPPNASQPFAFTALATKMLLAMPVLVPFELR